MPEPTVAVLSDTPCELGEGPGYDPVTDTAWWFDILGRKLFEHRFASGETRVQDLPVMASALAAVDADRQLMVAEDGLYIREVNAGALRRHIAIGADDPSTRSNDARVHPSGTFWVSTMGLGAEAGAGTIYAFRKGELQPLFSGITIPNAICFSPDGAIGYYADTKADLLYRVELAPLTGLPTGGPAVFIDHRGKDGGLDGAVVDADGVLWVACWGGSAVLAYAPDGRLVRTIEVPARQPSCPAFVGTRADRMLVTSAWEGLDDAARADDPQAGFTFVLDLGFKGRFDPPVLV